MPHNWRYYGVNNIQDDLLQPTSHIYNSSQRHVWFFGLIYRILTSKSTDLWACKIFDFAENAREGILKKAKFPVFWILSLEKINNSLFLQLIIRIIRRIIHNKILFYVVIPVSTTFNSLWKRLIKLNKEYKSFDGSLFEWINS